MSVFVQVRVYRHASMHLNLRIRFPTATNMTEAMSDDTISNDDKSFLLRWRDDVRCGKLKNVNCYQQRTL